MPRSLLVALLLSVSATMVLAQDKPQMDQRFDPHFAQGPMQILMAHCPFVHGYLYGYDEGFYQGDLDLQLARGRRDFEEHKRYRAGKPDDFKGSDGGSAQFRVGYRSGYAAGYFDSYAGRHYRALAAAKLAASDADTPAKSTAKKFATSFMLGYEAGLAQGRMASVVEVDYTLPEPPCSARGLDCGAYARGFMMGFPDGYLQASDVPPSPRELRAMKAGGVQTASAEGAR